MKNAAEHLQRIRRLFNQVKKEGGASALPPIDEPVEALLRGVLSDYAADSRAASALSRLRTAVVDLNELRVTPVSEIGEQRFKPGQITETLLNDYMALVRPKKQAAAE